MTKIFSINSLFLMLGTLLSFISLNAKYVSCIDVFDLGNFSVTMASKSMTVEEQVIAFGEKMTLNDGVKADVSWTIKDLNTNLIVAFGSGDSLLRYIFSTPGNYQIDIVEPPHHDPDDCTHDHLPEQVLVKVGSIRMTYDMSSLVLSKEIIGGQETEGTTLTINAFVEIYDNLPKPLPHQTFKSSGVKTTIVGTLKNPNQLLSNGINILEFSLSGTALSNTYIMFDFLDYNGKIQCYYLMNKIK